MRSSSSGTAPRLLSVVSVIVALGIGIAAAGGHRTSPLEAPEAAPGRGSEGGPSLAYREQDVPEYEPVNERDHRVGRIEIPRVGVSATILEGVDFATIRRAVGHFPETPLPDTDGNMALAAHRTTDFRGLQYIRIGDVITITTPSGRFSYVVETTFVVDPEDTYVLDPTAEKTLTLVTCYPFDYHGSAPYRFIVRARAQAR